MSQASSFQFAFRLPSLAAYLLQVKVSKHWAPSSVAEAGSQIPLQKNKKDISTAHGQISSLQQPHPNCSDYSSSAHSGIFKGVWSDDTLQHNVMKWNRKQ